MHCWLWLLWLPAAGALKAPLELFFPTPGCLHGVRGCLSVHRISNPMYSKKNPKGLNFLELKIPTHVLQNVCHVGCLFVIRLLSMFTVL
ncbi:MAG: hypothetical protein IKK45_06190, partial [Akkermansia sp.]|nr:hypothetical protein [Akkermansia sp.]